MYGYRMMGYGVYGNDIGGFGGTASWVTTLLVWVLLGLAIFALLKYISKK